ncbi:hypothetical protein AB0F77_31815 [Streptomyces sp. NPDC026672]|uniref:hypothetical protein n=1 Tax=unclassified Streptomyces TaxID=2593676 RepID=UPI0033D7B46F
MELTRWPDVWIGAAVTLPGAREEATGGGDRARSVLRPAGAAGPADVVLRAARAARERPGAPAGALDLVVHAASGRDRARGGTAARVSHGLGCRGATAWEVWRPAGGGVLALHLAARYVSGRPWTPLTALVTSEGGTDRPGTRGGRGAGPGATGLLLSTTAGVARVLSTAVLDDQSHGALFRSDLAWRVPAARTFPRTPAWVRDRGRRTAAGRQQGVDRREGVDGLGPEEHEAVRLALAECGRKMADVVRFALPAAGGGTPSCDEMAVLVSLLDEEALRRGDIVVLAGGDRRGFGCAVLERC